MKKLIVFILLIFELHTYAQEALQLDKAPVFIDCENIEFDALQNCFDNKVFSLIYENLEVPQKVFDENYSGKLVVLFEVDKEGKFRVLYTDAMYQELKDEALRVFSEFPKIKPGTYNGKPTFKQYSMEINIPLEKQQVATKDLGEIDKNENSLLEQQAKNEIDSVNQTLTPYKDREFKSQLNIPFTHSFYSKFDRSMNIVGSNSHTAAKPFLYDEASNYYNFETEKQSLLRDRKTWAGRKLWNEHLVQLQGNDYWFTIDPIFDLQVGKDFDADFDTTFNNTRGFLIQGGLGKNLNFYSSFFESQGRFAQYVNGYAESLKAYGPDPAIIPGRGIAKAFKDDAYDYPVAEAYLSYTPAKFINLQFGHGKNFIGDGYRSLFQSDVASPHPFFKKRMWTGNIALK